MVTSARKSILISAMAEGGRTGRNSRGRAWQDLGFLLLRTISYFTYEMANTQSEAARDGGFRKQRHGCRCFRPVRLDAIYPFH